MTYIEREALREEMQHIYDCICHMSTCLTVEECNARKMAMEMVGKALKEAPAADVAPVKHGKWLPVDGVSPCDEWDCSACDERRTYVFEMSYEDMQEFYRYCPNCGAKMDLED